MKAFSMRANRRARIYASTLLLAVALPFGTLSAAPADNPQIVQSRGVDASVDYGSLTKFGQWDDRNYQLTKADLAVLAKNEHELFPGIPAFFRVELRKEWPHLMKTGPAQYPRAARQLFFIRHGGIMRNGRIINAPYKGIANRVPVDVNGEVQLNSILGANEPTVEINRANPDQVIAGSNNNGGQEMYFSTDGGVTWNIQGVLPNTCCDPTVGWSSDGSVAYVAALSGSIGVSFWRSFDGGQTWVDRNILTNSGSDKEWLHVDISPTSPHQDNVYLSYHNGNVMQFARSSDQGTNFDIQAFPAAPRGIGSDITTTSNGDVYHFYGAFNEREITLLKSTNGGVSFQAPITVASTNGAFDWPIPAFESRRAWIYVAADADRSGGTYDGSVYAAWTDTFEPETGSAANNHTQIKVYYSRDGGATWDFSIPHPEADVLTVDRFNQWLTVDENGVVHVVFYDTRNSTNRTGVDLYYTFSTDGAQTWNELTRISSQTSANLTDGQEWGDYNGISVVGDRVIPIWTDNREGPPNQKDIFAADVVNAAASPGFTLAGDNTVQGVCAPGSLDDITVQVGSVQEFNSPVTLNLTGLPAGFTGGFSTNPVTPGTPPGLTTLSLSVGGAAAAGSFDFTVDGTASGADNKSLALSVDVTTSAPGATVLVSPANGGGAQSLSPTLTWNAASQAVSYIVEIDDDANFGSIDYSAEETGTTHVVADALGTDTVYYWRVRAVNLCGDGASSQVFTFLTPAILCRNPNLDIVDDGTTSDIFAIADTGEIEDLDVSIVANHTYVGDLSFTLTHEDTGTSVTIIDRPGVPGSFFGCSADDIDVTLDDSAGSAVENVCGSNPAIGGTHSPNNPLSAFNGEDLGGTWTLRVDDAFAQDSGEVVEWCLQPSLAAPPADSDGDGVVDATDNCTLVANPDQRDTNGDGIGNVCDQDLNNNCVINFEDLGLLKAVFFTNDPDADFDGNGSVSFEDLGAMKTAFFGLPGPSATGCN
ncbi:MAG: proprotein convertase P-domain-containing protein [Pseudomonadota bacterium]